MTVNGIMRRNQGKPEFIKNKVIEETEGRLIYWADFD